MRIATAKARPRRWARLLASVAALTLGVLAATPAHANTATTTAAADYPVGGLATAVLNFTVSPDRVAGANDWDCEPSAAHPEPVVLVHATFANLGMNWAALSPTLANEGYCVYAFNYGQTLLSLNRIGGLDDIGESAQTLQRFVELVRWRTGSAKVDLVGHSQGGMLTNYYIKRLGGADKVRRSVALAPSNHGTTLSGLTSLAESFRLLGLIDTLYSVAGTPALSQQIQGSDFQKALWADGDTVPGPHYTVIATNRDWVVTPYTNAFLKGPNVKNITLQDQCPANPVSHIGMFVDGPTLQNVLNALGSADPNFKPACRNYGPSI